MKYLKRITNVQINHVCHNFGNTMLVIDHEKINIRNQYKQIQDDINKLR